MSDIEGSFPEGSSKPPPRWPVTVGVLYSDVRREYFPTEEQFLSEKDALHEAQVVASYLDKLGIKSLLYPGDSNLPQKLGADRPEMVFNLVGSVKGNEYAASTIPGVLELLDIPYTGAGTLGESLTYNKFLIKRLLQQVGVPVPYFQLFNTPSDPLDTNLRFPLISKLNEIHGAVEIHQDSVSENEKHLRERLKYLITTYKQPVIVEEFIVGREIVGILLEGLNKKIYLAERIFSHKEEEKYIFATFEDQWSESGADAFHYQKYENDLLRDYVKLAFDVTKMTDYGKFDIRQDISGRYFFIDCNSNPAFGPKELGIAMGNIMDLYGISFTEVLKRLIKNTLQNGNGENQL